MRISEQQCGFQLKTSTADVMFALRVLTENYVDLEKAYDRVSREELWHSMRKS